MKLTVKSVNKLQKSACDVSKATSSAAVKPSKITGIHRKPRNKYLTFNTEHYTLYDLTIPQSLPANVTEPFNSQLI